MNKLLKNPFVWIVGIVLLVSVFLGNQYNSFITTSNSIDGQWKQVEVQYQRRFDLIPNLTESVKGIMKQEQTIFGDLAKARANYAGAVTTNDKATAATQLESSLSRLLVIMENYPQLKSDQAVLKLQDELAGTENRIAVERRRFNELVQIYNTKATTIPGNLLAKLFGFTTKEYFNATSGSQNAPSVKF